MEYIRPSKKDIEEITHAKILHRISEGEKKRKEFKKRISKVGYKVGKGIVKGFEIKGSVKPIKRISISKVEYLQRKRLLG